MGEDLLGYRGARARAREARCGAHFLDACNPEQEDSDGDGNGDTCDATRVGHMNCDGSVNFFDTDPFVELVTGG